MDETTGVKIVETWTLEKIRDGEVYETIDIDEHGQCVVRAAEDGE